MYLLCGSRKDPYPPWKGSDFPGGRGGVNLPNFPVGRGGGSLQGNISRGFL